MSEFCMDEVIPSNTIAFTGPRPYKLPGNGKPEAVEIQKLQLLLEQAIINAIRQNKTFFINGCMAGFDVIAGETVLRLKHDFPHIRCITVAPFQVGFFKGRQWTNYWKQRAKKLYLESDFSVALKNEYSTGVYYFRDRYMVNFSSGIICYYTGTGGGTKYTVDYAVSKNLPVQNLADYQPNMVWL